VEALLLDAAPLERGEALSLFSSLSARRRLTLPEAARLAKTEDPAVWEAAAKAARAVREEVFGRRVVLFAPLYLSNHCGNNCLYCGFRAGNRDEVRVSLTPEQAVEEARFLYGKGFRRLLLVTGEHPGRTQVDYLTSVLRAVYRDGTMRILHVNAAPMAVDELKEIKKAGAGVFQVFQETYHPGTYAVMHPSGRKADYAWRLTCMDRAMEAGFGDVGVGPLLGLYDWRFEALAVVRHSEHLFERFGAFPHTLSVPRFKPAFGSPLTEAPSPVSDGDFEKVVVLYRLAVPSAGVVVSTREPAPLRERCLEIGASQISAGSKVDPGGYATGERKADREQFPVGDTRSLDEVVRMVLDRGHVPSLCTACYRSGRTGDTFTEMAMDGHVRDFCLPNALLTLAEYAVEREPGDLKERCLEAVRKESAALAGSPVEAEFGRRLARTLAGEKDLHF
jgi:2-iminoacetate synthase